MKTSLTCLGILIVALAIGRWQGSRIDKLEHRMESTPALRATKVSLRAEREEDFIYRKKNTRRSTGATATEVFETIIAIPRPRAGVSLGTLGTDVALVNREAMQAIMQLDLSGLEELMTLIANSKSPALESPYRQEKAILCLIAMADVDSREALEHVMAGEEWHRIFGDFPKDDFPPMLSYVLVRLASEDPQAALAYLSEIRRKLPGDVGDRFVIPGLWMIARYDPGLVFEAMEKLPEVDQTAALDYSDLSDAFHSDDEHTALFHAYRAHFASQPEQRKKFLVTLCGRFENSEDSPPEVRKWLDTLDVTDTEKLVMFDGLRGINVLRSDGEQFAKWFAGFMPESRERDLLVWKACCEWDASDPPAAAAFLKEQGIDREEMLRWEMEAQ